MLEYLSLTQDFILAKKEFCYKQGLQLEKDCL